MVSDKPPIGKNPFEREIAANTGSLSLTGMAPKLIVSRNLDDPWFEQQRTVAERGIGLVGLKAWMEVRFALVEPTDKTPRELLDAVQRSEIKTFGWPIGVTLQSQAEWRPKPTDEGIRAEVAVPESTVTGRNSYDYWALTRGGDFYLLQSFFEDMRGKNLVFFNTRIVRVAEALLFGANLYTNLGVPGETKLKVCITHKGLAGRELATSSPSRLMFEKRISEASTSTQEFVLEVGMIQAEIVERVRSVCSPMFELFDFAEFGQSIYEDIVTKFINGVVT